MRFMQSFSL